MYLTARFRQISVSAWPLWAIVCLVFVAASAVGHDGNVGSPPALTGVVTHDSRSGPLVPWQPVHRSRRWLAISQHTRDIWQDVVHRALVQANIDLSVIFYDLTAFALHGSYADSEHVNFGFAHNTPMNKRKFKAGLDVAADGNVPTEYGLWAGRTADMATVQENMERLCRLLRGHGWSVQETIIIGDRANLNDELAIAYDDHTLRYLAGLQPQKKVHRELLTARPEAHFYPYPLTNERGGKGYWGIPCQVVFEHQERQVVHKGLIVLHYRTLFRRLTHGML